MGSEFIDFLEASGYLGLFIGSFLSATIIPFASEGVLAYLLYEGFNPVICLVLATFGNTLGGLTGYYLGFLGKWKLLQRWFGIKEHQVDRFMLSVQKYGSLLAFLCWLPFIGDFIAVALGLGRASFWRTTFFMALGKGLRYAVVIGLYFLM